jgi:hypothetical protein
MYGSSYMFRACGGVRRGGSVWGARGVVRATAPQLSISQKALGKLPEKDNVMPKHVGATIHN